MSMEGKLGVRHVQAVLLSGALMVNHMQMGNFGIAVMVMTQADANRPQARVFYAPEADSKAEKVSMMTGSFFYSHMIFSIIGGYLCTKINNKRLILASSIIGIMGSYLTPTLVRIFDWRAFFLIRLTQGAAQGVVKPLVYTMAARWLPTEEMLLLGPGIICGVYTGLCFMLMMGGYLGAGHGGWPTIFYFTGNCGLLWTLAFYGLGFATPDECFFISDLEKDHINRNVPASVLSPYRHNIPWKKIFTNIPLLALLISQTANNWAYQIFVKVLPIYLQQNLHYGLDKTGIMCGMPFLLGCIAVYAATIFFKYLWNRGKLNHIVVRHLCNAMAQFGCAYCFMICSCSESLIVTLFFHQMGTIISLFQIFGFYMNYYDLSPTYVGLTSGIINGIATVGSIIGPHIAMDMYNQYGDDKKAWIADRQFIGWRKSYDLISLNYFIAGTTFMFLGQVKEQDFDKNEERKPTKRHK